MRGLRYISWADTTGYAVAAKAYLRALAAHDVPVAWAPMMPDRHGYTLWRGDYWPEPDLAPLVRRDVSHDTVVLHSVPEYYPPLIDAARRDGHRVLGYTVWELEHLPDHWPAILNRLDGVLVPCRWNVEVFKRSGVTVPVHVVPHLSQFEALPDAGTAARAALARRLGEPLEGRFVFYTVGLWSARKSSSLVVEAYLDAFTANDPVVLVVKTSRRDVTRRVRRWRSGFRRRFPSPLEALGKLISRYPKPARIICIADEDLPDPEMLALHEVGDCFVSLARTEGWGLGAFEAARLGKPVIMTGYGGQLDFLDPDLSYLVDFDMVPVDEPVWRSNYRPTDRWAAPSLDHASRMMRKVFSDPEEARRRAGLQSKRIATRFATERTVKRMLDALQ